jgi:hypothetical protein
MLNLREAWKMASIDQVVDKVRLGEKVGAQEVVLRAVLFESLRFEWSLIGVFDREFDLGLGDLIRQVSFGLPHQNAAREHRTHHKFQILEIT